MTMFEPYELFSLLQPSQVITATGTTIITQAIHTNTVTETQCRLKVEANLQWISSAWHGGCGWDNFRSIFKKMCNELTGLTETKMNWEGFDTLWDELYEPYQDFSMRYAYIMKFDKNAHPGMYVKDFTKLLQELCKK